MAAVRCNNPECLQIFIMCEGPDFASEDVEGNEPVIIPKACPYCGDDEAFTVISDIVDLDIAICEFGEEERGYG
jgi:hypothetical protein